MSIATNDTAGRFKVGEIVGSGGGEVEELKRMVSEVREMHGELRGILSEAREKMGKRSEDRGRRL
jgi:hypothetical protein